MNTSAILLSAAAVALGLAADARATAFEQIAEFTVPEANQGMGVDERQAIRRASRT